MLTALADDPVPVLSTHTGEFKTAYNSSSRGGYVLWLLQTSAHTDMPVHKHTHKIIFKNPYLKTDKISKCKSRAYKILTSKQGVNIVVTADSGDTFFHTTQMQEETVKIDK